MATSFPGSNDTFTEPNAPGSTPLVSAGSGTRNHTAHHRDLGDAIQAMQPEATVSVHSHDGSTFRHGSKLSQANTHQSPDTDTSTSALHHTIGAGSNQAAAGNHIHSHPIVLYFVTSGTTAFTKATYPGLYAIYVECVGAGGGSAGCAITDGSHIGIGTGGGGGAYAQAVILASALSSSETITVGVGGVAGVGGSGSSGGASSFGAFLIAGGGGGGNYSSFTSSGSGQVSSGSGGTSSGSASGAVKIKGGDGVSSITSGSMTQVDAFRGARSGGSYGSTVSVTTGAPFNIASNGSLASGVAGRAVGGGASGTAITVSTAARNGAAGATGLVIVRLIF